MEQTAYEAVELLGTKGGWTEWAGKWNASKGKAAAKSVKGEESGASDSTPAAKRRKVAASEEKKPVTKRESSASSAKAAADKAASAAPSGVRRSTRNASK